jgi:glycosyltransferase involved in cell wall biosynthesis
MNVHFLIPGDINTLTGGYVYDKKIFAGLSEKGHKVTIHQLGEDFPFPKETSLAESKKILREIPPGEPVIIDSLAFGPMISVISEYYRKNSIIALVHLPLSFNPGFSAEISGNFAKQEKTAFDFTAGIVTTSSYTCRLLAGYNIDPSRIDIIKPGAEAKERKIIYLPFPKKLLCIGSYLENKGQSLLIKALALLKDKDWILNCYGNPDLDRKYFEGLQVLIKNLNLEEKVLLHGIVLHEKLSKIYLEADLFVLPSHFETYGMVLAEALVHGLPVIASTGGGILDTVPASMGKFFNPGNELDLVKIIKLILEDPTIYSEMCNNAAMYYRQANSWATSVELFEQMLVRISKKK